MGRISHDILNGRVRPNTLDRASEEFGYFTSGEVKGFALLRLVYGEGHVIRSRRLAQRTIRAALRTGHRSWDLLSAVKVMDWPFCLFL